MISAWINPYNEKVRAIYVQFYLYLILTLEFSLLCLLSRCVRASSFVLDLFILLPFAQYGFLLILILHTVFFLTFHCFRCFFSSLDSIPFSLLILIYSIGSCSAENFRYFLLSTFNWRRWSFLTEFSEHFSSIFVAICEREQKVHLKWVCFECWLTQICWYLRLFLCCNNV